MAWSSPGLNPGSWAGAVSTGDVIEEANGERVTPEEWAVRTARLAAGDTITLRVRGDGQMREVVLVARVRESTNAEGLGLIMRSLPGVGTEVVHVLPLTAAHRAGVEPGDVITRAGQRHAPTPGEVRSAYASGEDGRGVLLALTRGSGHRVVVLQR